MFLVLLFLILLFAGDPTFHYGGVSHSFVGGSFNEASMCYWGNNYCKGWTQTSTQPSTQNMSNFTKVSGYHGILPVLLKIYAVERNLETNTLYANVTVDGGIIPYHFVVRDNKTVISSFNSSSDLQQIIVRLKVNETHNLVYVVYDAGNNVGDAFLKFHTSSEDVAYENQNISSNTHLISVSKSSNVVIPVINYTIISKIIIQVLIFGITGIFIFVVVLKRKTIFKKFNTKKINKERIMCLVCDDKPRFISQEKLKEHMVEEHGV